ncbi:hypothetical protein CYMTET_8636 [Cymbomonas tetramitiformis]|uniref:Uncharacterized protein n=1 Tax=Cymbomonas tetramitiformis TaxID=36881 RepID=A0AAE0GT82_9CHLO|nr:hypothetical protein CYMTET_8636 [Cymbomonas tetramitiformis]
MATIQAELAEQEENIETQRTRVIEWPRKGARGQQAGDLSGRAEDRCSYKTQHYAVQFMQKVMESLLNSEGLWRTLKRSRPMAHQLGSNKQKAKPSAPAPLTIPESPSTPGTPGSPGSPSSAEGSLGRLSPTRQAANLTKNGKIKTHRLKWSSAVSKVNRKRNAVNAIQQAAGEAKEEVAEQEEEPEEEMVWPPRPKGPQRGASLLDLRAAIKQSGDIWAKAALTSDENTMLEAVRQVVEASVRERRLSLGSKFTSSTVESEDSWLAVVQSFHAEAHGERPEVTDLREEDSCALGSEMSWLSREEDMAKARRALEPLTRSVSTSDLRRLNSEEEMRFRVEVAGKAWLDSSSGSDHPSDEESDLSRSAWRVSQTDSLASAGSSDHMLDGVEGAGVLRSEASGEPPGVEDGGATTPEGNSGRRRRRRASARFDALASDVDRKSRASSIGKGRPFLARVKTTEENVQLSGRARSDKAQLSPRRPLSRVSQTSDEGAAHGPWAASGTPDVADVPPRVELPLSPPTIPVERSLLPQTKDPDSPPISLKRRTPPQASITSATMATMAVSRDRSLEASPNASIVWEEAAPFLCLDPGPAPSPEPYPTLTPVEPDFQPMPLPQPTSGSGSVLLRAELSDPQSIATTLRGGNSSSASLPALLGNDAGISATAPSASRATSPSASRASPPRASSHSAPLVVRGRPPAPAPQISFNKWAILQNPVDEVPETCHKAFRPHAILRPPQHSAEKFLDGVGLRGLASGARRAKSARHFDRSPPSSRGMAVVGSCKGVHQYDLEAGRDPTQAHLPPRGHHKPKPQATYWSTAHNSRLIRRERGLPLRTMEGGAARRVASARASVGGVPGGGPKEIMLQGASVDLLAGSDDEDWLDNPQQLQDLGHKWQNYKKEVTAPQHLSAARRQMVDDSQNSTSRSSAAQSENIAPFRHYDTRAMMVRDAQPRRMYAGIPPPQSGAIKPLQQGVYSMGQYSGSDPRKQPCASRMYHDQKFG